MNEMPDLDLTTDEQKQIEQLISSDPIGEKQTEKYVWDLEFQKEIVGLLLNDKQFVLECIPLIKPEYFTGIAHELAVRTVFSHFNKYKALPTRAQFFEALKNLISQKSEDTRAYILTEAATVYNHYIPGIETRDYYRDKITNFAKSQALKRAFHSCLELINKDSESEESWTKIEEQLRNALTVEHNFEMGLDYFGTVEERYARTKKAIESGEVFTTGFPKIDAALKGGGFLRGEIGSWMGLCFAKGTKVRMFDGTVKKVEDVEVGDLVMGNDSTPRKVLRLARGQDQMYQIIPVKGKPYIVNSNHVLSLKNCNRTPAKKSGTNYIRPNCYFANHPARMGSSDIFNISVKDYLSQTEHFKKSMKGWRTGVEYPFKKTLINPYMLGVWLGDGDHHQAAITTIDKEIEDAIYTEAVNRGLSIRHDDKLHYFFYENSQKQHPCGKGKSKNTLMNDLRSYDLLCNYRTESGLDKHIPFDYLVNDRKTRLELLAGILDTDGSLSCSGFDFINKSKQLAEDVVTLAQSLGFAATIKSCTKECQTGVFGTYWRVFISGDCSIILVRIARKKAPKRKQYKNHLVTGITINPVGYDDFYGFEVDGNHLFLLDDFTVTHNSGTGKSLALVATTVANLKLGHKVLYISLEMDEDRTAERFDAQLGDCSRTMGLSIKNLSEKENVVIQGLGEFISDYDDKKLLVIKQFPGGQMDIPTLRAYFSQVKLRGFIPDVVIIDYVGEMKDYPGMPTHESRYRIVRDLRGFAVEEKIVIFTAMQPNRSAKEAIKNGLLIDDENIGDAYAQIKPLDALWSINQFQEEKEAGLARIFVVKHRFGESRFVIYVQYDRDTLSITEISKQKYEDIMKRHRLTKEKTVDDAFKEDAEVENKKKMYETMAAASAKKKENSKLLQGMMNGGYDAEDIPESGEVDEDFVNQQKER